MAIQIEKGVPVPRGRRTGGAALYPFREMEVGDSFEVKLEESCHASLTHLQNSVSACGRMALGRGSVSVRLNEARDGVRAWRLA